LPPYKSAKQADSEKQCPQQRLSSEIRRKEKERGKEGRKEEMM
jgi:hypothetical protein